MKWGATPNDARLAVAPAALSGGIESVFRPVLSTPEINSSAMTEADPNRARLRAAVTARDAAREAVAKASAAADASKALLMAEDRKLKSFEDVEDAIVQHRAASYARAAKGGAKPSLELPADLLKRERLRDEARAAFRAAKAAYDGLFGELADAENVLRKSERLVSEAAVAILTAEGAAQGASLTDIWNNLWATVDSLNALRSFGAQLPRPTILALQTLAQHDHRQFTAAGNTALARAREGWKARHDALCKNADAEIPKQEQTKQAAA
jgi:hypothetical protein